LDQEGRILTGNWEDLEDIESSSLFKRQPHQRVDSEFVQTPAFAGYSGNSFYQVDSLIKPQLSNSLNEVDETDRNEFNSEETVSQRLGKS